MADEKKGWVEICARIRQTTELLPAKIFDQCLAMGTPTMLRPKSVYSPLKAKDLKALYGDGWYELIHPSDDIMVLPGNRFRDWCGSEEIKQIVAANITWVLQQQGKQKKTAAQWYRLLQAAYDFGLPEVFDRLFRSCLAAQSWSPLEVSLFYLVW